MSIRSKRLTIVGKPLDDPETFSETTGAWSVSQKLRRGYKGPLCRIRRVSDNQEQDIGAIGGKLDFNALRDFAGVSMDARVVTVYDQTGGTNHLTQSIPENQPVLQPQGPVRQLSSPQVLGGEVFSASSIVSNQNPEYSFNGQYYGFWHSDAKIQDDPLSFAYDVLGTYNGNNSTTVSGSSIPGEWLQIEFAQAICITKFSISPRDGWEYRVPDTCTLAGSNNGTSWKSIRKFTDVSGYQYQVDTIFDVSTNGAVYTHYRLIFEKLTKPETPNAYTNNSVQITQFKIYGTPLQDLDGSLRMVGGYLTPVSHPVNNSYVYQQGSTITELTQETTQPVENPDLGAALLESGAPVTGPYELNGYSVEASSVNLGTSPKFAFNKTYGSDADIWLSDGALPVWLSITYPDSVVCTRYTIRSRDNSTYTRYPKAWTLQGLSTQGHWVILDDRVETSWDPNTVKEYTVSNAVACSTYRLYFTDAISSAEGSLVAIAQCRFFSTPARPPLDTIYMLPGSVEENPNLGSAVLVDGAGNEGPYELDGYVVEASAIYDPTSSSYNPKNAFDKTNDFSSDNWYSGSGMPHWISIQYPTPVALKEYSLTSRNRSSAWNPPHTWDIQGSNDGQTWTSIDYRYRSGAGLVGSNLTEMFQVSDASRSFTHYRMFVTESLTDSGYVSQGGVFIAQWRLFSYTGGMEKLLAKNTLATQSLPGQIRQRQQMPIQAVSYQDLVSLLSVSRKDLVVNSGKTSITDQASGQEWNFGLSAALALEDGVPCVDLSAGGLTLNGTGATLGQEYTLVYYWKPLVGATTYRTLHRNNRDHLATVHPTFLKLGFWSSRDSVVVDTGYNVIFGEWQTLIVTSTGDSSTSSTGVGTYYVNDTNVGTVDKVGCGTYLSYIGASNDPDIDPDNLRPPGHVAVAGVFNRILNRKEITKVHRLLERWGQGQYTQQIPKSVGGAKSYSVPGGHQGNPALGPFMMYSKFKLVSGVYWVKPPGYSGDPFQVFVDFEHDGQGWILVSKWGGHSKTLDKIFNALAYDTTGTGTEILNPNFGAFDTYARLGRDQMNALWNVSDHVCRIHFKNSDYTTTSGIYFQRKLLNTDIDFWHAHYNAAIWSDGVTGDSSDRTWAFYGTPPTFASRLAKATTTPDWTTYSDSADFDPSDNSFGSQDNGIGAWDYPTVVSAPNYGDLTIVKHMGFFGDVAKDIIGIGNHWLFTSNPGDSRFNRNENRQSMVWLRCWSTVLAFHYGPHDGTYGDSSASGAASNGHFFSDASTVDTPWFGTVSVESHGDQTTYTWKPPSGQSFIADVLVVAGGGGGGAGNSASGVGGGGGGAGGLLFNSNMVLTNATLTIKVGKGGDPGVLSGSRGQNGQDSQFDTIATIGGGGGGTRLSDVTGGNGGSGGGGSSDGSGVQLTGGTGITEQGYNGGNSTNASPGGGGGAGGAGGDGNRDTPDDASGGPGLQYPSFSKFGESGWFAGGGGPGQGTSGAHSSDRFDGGIGGGGDGAFVNGDGGGNGLKHSGGGGGGGPSFNATGDKTPGAGGSGIVLVRVHV